MSASNWRVRGSKFMRQLAKVCGVMAILASFATAAARADEPRAGEFPWQISLQTASFGGDSQARSSGARAGGGDIVVLDIVDEVAQTRDEDGTTKTLYEAFVFDGDSVELRLVVVEESRLGVIRLQIMF